MKVCAESGCEKKLRARGLCSYHYGRARHYGLIQPLPPLTEAQRAARVESRKQYIREWRAKNRDRIEEYVARANASPAAKEANRRWYEKNRDRKIATTREWQERNIEHVKATRQAWLKANADKASEQRARRRARQVGATVERINRGAVAYRDGFACYLCGVALDGLVFHLDHTIPLAKGGEHSYRNVGLACGPCNQRKHAQDPRVDPRWRHLLPVMDERVRRHYLVEEYISQGRATA